MKAFNKLREYMTNEQHAKKSEKKLVDRQLLLPAGPHCATPAAPPPPTASPAALPVPSTQASGFLPQPPAYPAYQQSQYARAAPAPQCPFPQPSPGAAAPIALPTGYPSPNAPSPPAYTIPAAPAFSLPASHNYYCHTHHQQPAVGYPMPPAAYPQPPTAPHGGGAVMHAQGIPQVDHRGRNVQSKKDKRQRDKLREAEKQRQFREVKLQYEYQQYKEHARRDNGREQFHTAGVQTCSSSMTALAILPEIFKAIF